MLRPEVVVAPKPPTPGEVLASRRGEFIAFVERRVRDRALAEDLVQGAFAHGLARIDEVRDEASVVAWFYRSLRNAIIDRHRRRTREERALENLAKEVDERVDVVEAAPAQFCKCVLKVALGLKQEYADALQRITVEEAAVHEFADERGISRANAAVRIFRAREALRQGLLETCGACAEGGCVDCTCDHPAPDVAKKGCGKHAH